ncbi:MAG: hypothetical protein ACXIUM_10425 [Wenzhouxiangella sp.]
MAGRSAQIDSAALRYYGQKFCSKPEEYPNELPPAMLDIDYRTTKARSPRTNVFVKRMNSIWLDGWFRIKGLEKWYESADQTQGDLDEFL